MKQRTVAIALCAMFSSVMLAQRVNNGRSSFPEYYFLNIDEVPNSQILLPPPPSEDSAAFKYDEACYDWGKSMRDTERGEQAARDAHIEGDGVPQLFSEAFGIEISKDKTPEIYKLVLRLKNDAGDLATRHAKEYYKRERPFVHYGEDTCVPEQQEELAKNGSYPSGHTSIGWATALVLAEINPDRQIEILKRGLEMGESRVICGYHYQSDVDAGRIVGSAVVARLHADRGFTEQLAKAKAEFAECKAKGLVGN